MVTHKRLLLSTMLVLLPAQASGDVAGDAWRQAQELDQRREGEERTRRQQQLRTPTPAVPTAPLPRPASQACVPVAGLALRGNRKLSHNALQQVATPLMATCLGPTEVNNLLAGLTAAYVRAGYITARPYLAAPLRPGAPLEVLILEGQVETIEVEGKTLPLSLRNALGDLYGQPLHLPTFERGLDQLNRLNAFNLTSDILPGTTPGASRLVLHPQASGGRIWGSAILDSSGSFTTGRNRATVQAGLDSPLHLNDSLNAHASRTLPSGPRFSQAAGLNYSLPYGAWRLSLGALRYNYQSQLPGSHKLGHGYGAQYTGAVERELWRSGQGIVSAAARLSRKQTNTFEAGRFVAVQSPHYDTVDLHVDALWLGWAQWASRLQYSEGLGGWSANDGLRQPTSHAPEARFQAWRLNLSQVKGWYWGPQPLNWASQLNLQYSDDSLPSTEHLALQASHGVRGFRDLAASYERGVTWNNTLSAPLALPGGFIAVPHMGADLGWGDGRSHAKGQRLGGATLGLALKKESAVIELDYHHPVYQRHGSRERGYWQLQLSTRF